MIKSLSRRQIDTEKWDAVVASSAMETIYPYSWYMDTCSANWMGLVMNDYECIMPVAYKSKLGLKYTYQPIYCQQAGVLSAVNVDPEISRIFLHALSKQFRLGDYAFNEGNVLGEEPGFEETDCVNYTLPLNKTYEELLKNYTENCRRNVKKSRQAEIEITEDLDVEEVVRLKKLSEEVKRPQAHYEYVKRLFGRLKELEKLKIIGVKSGDHLVSAGLFACSEKRIIMLLSASSDLGKDYRGMFHIIDHIIQKHAGEEKVLDFEGSNIASIARFFRGFGAKPGIYQRISFENSSSKLLKKIKGG